VRSHSDVIFVESDFRKVEVSLSMAVYIPVRNLSGAIIVRNHLLQVDI